MALMELTEARKGIDFGTGEFPGSRNDYSPASKEWAEFTNGTALGIEWGETWEPEMFGELLACVMQPSFMRGFGFGAAVELSTPGTFVSADDDIDFGLDPSQPISIDESTFNTGMSLGAEWVQTLTRTPASADGLKAVTKLPHFLRGFAAGALECIQEYTVES